MYKNSVVHYIAKVAVEIMFYGGICCVLAVPFLSRWIMEYFQYSRWDAWIVSSALMLSGVCVVYILYQLKKMFRTLLGGDPFVAGNISCFRRMSVACALISLIYLAKMLLLFSLSTLVIVLVFAVACLFCLTLKDVFKQAVAYKEENDLTV